MTIIYSGFDTIEFAVKGAAKTKTIKYLDTHKDIASKAQRDIPVSFGADKRRGLIAPTGTGGGFAFILKFDGVLGHVIRLKRNLDRTGWNGHVKIRALALATYGLNEMKARVFSDLAVVGFSEHGVSLSRIDYAMDFLNVGIALDPTHFVTHSRVKKAAHKLEINTNSRGQSYESITLGKNPNRQIILYDKRGEVIAKRNPAWFEFWDIHPKDMTQTVHRVEIRLYKEELLKREIRTFDELRTKVIAAMIHAAEVIRYVTPREGDQNISRWPNHPLWDHVQAHVRAHMLRNPNYVDPARVKHVIREQKALECRKQVLGNMANLSVFDDMDPEQIKLEMTKFVQDQFSAIQADDSHPFWKSRAKTQDRFSFL